MEMYRQGGLLLIPVESAPSGRQVDRVADGRLVLAGVDSGRHAHAIVEAGATLVVDEWGEWFLTVTEAGGVNLTHEERAPVRVLPGSYRVALQRSHNYWPDQDELLARGY
jgi:hypothetical protein